MAKILMKGNEAIAEAAIRAGCKAFFGYPITPQNEIPEYFARELPRRGGVFLQAESELAAMNMVMGASASGARVMTSTSGPGFCLKLEALAGMALAKLPAVIVVVMRNGPAFGTMHASQEDYRMCGNGGYRVVKLAPSTVQEAADMVTEAFDIADQYRNPVLIMADGMIGQMMGIVDFEKVPAARENLPTKEWALRGKKERNGQAVFHFLPEGRTHYEERHYEETILYPLIEKQETKAECAGLEEADIVLAAYGTAAGMCKAVAEQLKGTVRTGLIRPRTLWPYPYEAFEKIGRNCKAIVVPEINIIGQMIDDVRIAASGRWPVCHVGDSCTGMLTPAGIMEKVKEVWKEVSS